jgi:hypothetical protein
VNHVMKGMYCTIYTFGIMSLIGLTCEGVDYFVKGGTPPVSVFYYEKDKKLTIFFLNVYR